MWRKTNEPLTVNECIAIAKRCRRHITFGRGVMYGAKQGEKAYAHAEDSVRKYRARLAEVLEILNHLKSRGVDND